MESRYLDKKDVPAHLRGAYSGNKLEARICERVTIPAHAGLWDGGSKDDYRLVRLADGAAMSAEWTQTDPWHPSRRAEEIELRQGFAVVCHSYFCGKDFGLRFYLHPSDVAALLAAPAPAEMSEHEKIALAATLSFKSSYNGKDRYEMARANSVWEHSFYHASKRGPFPTRDEWNAAKESLVARGFLNKAGAATNAGRNARPNKIGEE